MALVLFVCCFGSLFGQNRAIVNPYTHSILIGEPIRVDLIVEGSKVDFIEFPQFTDTITGHLEIISVGAIDTLYKDTLTKSEITGLKKQIVITSFDSGIWEFPELDFIVDYRMIHSEAFFVEVQTVMVDTSQVFKPIVEPIDLPMTWKELINHYYPIGLWIWGILIVLAVIAFFVGKDSEKANEQEPKVKILPHITALKRLEQLETDQLWQKGAFKAYHIELSDIVRQYLENRFDIQVLESTTDEVKHMLKQVPMNPGTRKEIIASLRISDLVKFAKATPTSEENENCLKTAYMVVNTTKLIPLDKVNDE